jgi:hypothetical protein
MLKKFFKYLRYKFLKKKKLKYKKIQESISISISYIEFEYNIIDDTKKYKRGFIQFREKSDFYL